MLSVRLLLLPLSASYNQRPLRYLRAFEDLLCDEGFSIRRASREEISADHLADSDLLLLEIEKNDSLRYVEQIRHASRKPIVLFGSNVPSAVWIQGLRIGADAYLSLPDSKDVVCARLQAVLRRLGLNQPVEQLQ